MDALQAIATSIGVIGLILLMVLLVLHFFGPRTAAWIHSNREEKIGFTNNRIYHANGYVVSVDLICYRSVIYVTFKSRVYIYTYIYIFQFFVFTKNTKMMRQIPRIKSKKESINISDDFRVRNK